MKKILLPPLLLFAIFCALYLLNLKVNAMLEITGMKLMYVLISSALTVFGLVIVVLVAFIIHAFLRKK